MNLDTALLNVKTRACRRAGPGPDEAHSRGPGTGLIGRNRRTSVVLRGRRRSGRVPIRTLRSSSPVSPGPHQHCLCGDDVGLTAMEG